MINQIDEDDQTPGLLSTATLVMWMTAVSVGIAGLVMAYPRPRPPPVAPPPLQATLVHVTLTPEAPSAREANAPPVPPTVNLPQPAPAPAAATPASAAPPMIAVAAPSPTIAFALPASGPTRTVAPAQAVPRGPTTPSTAPVSTSAPQHLTFGQGEGAQPAPEYPREAVLSHEQGTVVVEFTVGQDGSVTSAKASTPSAYPLLNQAAVRAVRDVALFAWSGAELRSID